MFRVIFLARLIVLLFFVSWAPNRPKSEQLKRTDFSGRVLYELVPVLYGKVPVLYGKVPVLYGKRGGVRTVQTYGPSGAKPSETMLLIIFQVFVQYFSNYWSKVSFSVLSLYFREKTSVWMLHGHNWHFRDDVLYFVT